MDTSPPSLSPAPALLLPRSSSLRQANRTPEPPTSDPVPLPRSAALTKLRRGASVREASPRDRAGLEGFHFAEREGGPSALPAHLVRSNSAVSRSTASDDFPLYANASLERTASLLARSMAMAKLTGSAPPTAPSSYYIPPGQSEHKNRHGFSMAPLPSLGALRERAEMRIKNGGMRPVNLRRNNTVTGVEVRDSALLAPVVETPPLAEAPVKEPAPTVEQTRAEARTNLMRKLSARRLAPNGSRPSPTIAPDLAVVGRLGKARPRSGSLGENAPDWQADDIPPVPSPLAFLDRTRTHDARPPLENIIVPAPTQFLPVFAPLTPAVETAPHSWPKRWSVERGGRRDSVNDGRPGTDERDMRARLQEEEEEDTEADDESEIGHPTPRVAATPRMFSDFEWTPTRPTTSEFLAYDSTPPSPSTRTSIGSISHPSDTPSSDNIPVVLRRGSIPQHLLSGRFPSSMSTLSSIEAGDSRAHKTASFGIGAVEEDMGVRRRGSSASSVLVFAGNRYRGSDAGFAFNERRGTVNFDTNMSSASLGLAPSVDSDHAHVPVEHLEEPGPAEVERRLVEVQLAAKVERNRASGLTRSRDGAFPPPEAGYQFPSPTFSAPLQLAPALNDDVGPYDDAPSVSYPILTHGYRPPSFPASLSPPIRSVAHLSPTREHGAALLDHAGSPDLSTRRVGVEMLKTPSHDSTFAHDAARHDANLSPPNPGERSDHDRSGYSSSNEMQRGLSSSSAGSFSFEPRQVRMPADQLPASRILQQLDDLLGTEELELNAPSAFDNPPRQLLLHAPVLQVVNANTVKDRHLFLFSDLLLIAKPIIEEDPITGQLLPSTLANSFITKSIVELRHLKLVASDDPGEEPAPKKRHPLLVAFVDRFANDPKRAIASLIQKGGLANDGATIANLLFRNPDLNRNQLGAYLADRDNKQTLRLYIERFRFAGVRLDDALRIFLMSIRLPYDLTTAEYVLGVVASQWTETNGNTGFDPSLTLSLVLAIMRLSDALHSGSATEEGLFSFPNASISVDDFIASFRERDVRMLVPEDLLTRIYASVRKERIEQASDNSMFSMSPDIEATIEPAKLPTRLTYRTPSDMISITIPALDPKFSIKLHGVDLKFEPNHLNFAKSATQSFRVTGTALGIRVMILIKYGANAPRYQGLPLNKAFSVERAFMQHTFQIGFVNHLDVKRKYMFSTLSGEVRASWIKYVREGIDTAVAKPLPKNRAILAAEMVAVQVLRDALIAVEEASPLTSFAAPSPRLNTAAPRFGTAGPLLPLLTAPRSARIGTGTSSRGGFGLVRSNSVSKTYAAGVGKGESDLLPDSNVNGRKFSTFGLNRGGVGLMNKEETFEKPFAKRGDEIALITEQNSLLPMVLSFLRAGETVAPHPVSKNGTAFQQRPLTPPSPSLSPPSDFPQLIKS